MPVFSSQSPGKSLIIVGALFLVLGLIFLLAGKIPFLGRLPGDIEIKKDGLSLHFPIVTCLVLSLVLTLVINLIFRR